MRKVLPEAPSAHAPGALDGVRVLDLTHGVAGPFATRLLGDLGAEVLKVEQPQRGDFARYLGPAVAEGPVTERGLLFQYLNWNKRGITLDLRRPDARPVLRELVARSDIVVEAFAPGTMARWGLDDDVLRDWKKDGALVLTSVTNFGRTGPYAHFAADDLVLYAMSGIMQISGRADREPLKHGLRQSLYIGGLNAAYATLAAYLLVDGTDGMEHVDVSIHECLASELVLNVAYYAFLGAIQGRRPVVDDPFSGRPLRTAKGLVSMQINGPATIAGYGKLLGQEKLLDGRYATSGGRTAHADELEQVLQEALAGHEARDLFTRGSEQRLLLGVVQGAAELLDCPQLTSRDFFVEVDHPVTGRYRFPGELARLSRTPTSVRRRAPLLGEHTEQVLLDELGMPQAQWHALVEAGAI